MDRRNSENPISAKSNTYPVGIYTASNMPGAVLRENALTPEFYELIYSADPEAANDDYYVTSEDFIHLHWQIKKDLIKGVSWWAIGVCATTAFLMLANV